MVKFLEWFGFVAGLILIVAGIIQDSILLIVLGVILVVMCGGILIWVRWDRGSSSDSDFGRSHSSGSDSNNHGSGGDSNRGYGSGGDSGRSFLDWDWDPFG